MRLSIKTSVSLAILLLCTFYLQAQTIITGTKIVLNSDDLGNKLYKARERVILKPGYLYAPGVSTNKMKAQIDETQVFNVNYAASLYDQITFNNRVNATPGNDVTIGATKGSATVDLTGSANYSIPIATPVGTNGMVPALAIAYNSSLGSGSLGVGWNIAGLSMITRSNKDLYHDNIVAPTSLAISDPYLLDGQRLILTSGTYGTAGSIYTTENESFSRITVMATGVNGPEWYKVELKNGMTMEYGNTADSKFMGEGADNTTVMTWRLNKVYDTYGNYMLYKYKSDQRDFRVDEILYTGNTAAGLAPYSRIKFFYDTRTDKNTFYVDGSTVKSHYLLTSINITGENGIFKTYRLTYGKDQIDSYLKEIQEFGADDAYMNSTIFKYNGFNPGAIMITSSDLPANQSGSGNGTDILTGDYNGDGQTDLAFMPFNTVSGVRHNTSLQTYIANDATSLDPFTPTSVQVNLANDNFSYVDGYEIPPMRQSFVTDVNGDGRDDILMSQIVVQSNGALHVPKVRLYEPDATGNLSTAHIDIDIDPIYREIPFESQFMVTGDFDGDGRADFLTTLEDKDYSGPNNEHPKKTTISLPGLSEYQTEVVNQGNHNPKRQIPLDYNGDGKTDILGIYSHIDNHIPNSYSYTTIKTYDRDVNNKFTATTLYSSGCCIGNTADYPSIDHTIWVGDFNGDNKSDLLTKNLSGVFEVAISKGVGNAFDITTFTLNTAFQSGDQISIGDYNGDGKSDIRHYYTTGNSPSLVMKNDIYYSTGKSTFYFNQIQNNQDGIASYTGVNIKGDFDGDGRDDVIVRSGGQPSTYFRMFFFNEYDRARLLHQVADGLNNVTTFNYVEMTQSAIHTKGTSSAYPIQDMNLQQPIVFESKMANGLGNETKYSYRYEGARVHLTGKGFLGFTKMTTDAKPHNYEYVQRSIQTFELLTPNNKYFVPFPKKITQKIIKYDALGINIIETNDVSETTNTYDLFEIGGIRSFLKLSSAQTNNFLTGAISVTTNTYDNTTGNMTGTSNVMKKGTNIGDEVETVTNVYSNFNSNGSWIANKPGQVTVTRLRTGQPQVTHTTTYGYSLQGTLSQEVLFFGQAKAITTLYAHGNSFGNVTSEAKSSPGLTQRVNTYTYDPKGRYAVNVTNPLGQTVTSEFDPRWGQPTKVTGVDGLSSYFEYDGFGSLKKKITPEGNQVSTSWAWAIDNTIKSYYQTTTTIPGRPTEKTWYDKLNRPVKHHEEGFDATWIETLTTYDARGFVASSTSPHYQGVAPTTYITSNNTYDKFNRIWTTISEFGTTTHAYTGGTIGQLTHSITMPDGQIRSTTSDAAGRTISATDFGGTLDYTFDSWGNQKEVKNGTTVLTSMVYDPYGKQQSLTDINAGPTSYNYNAYGELASQTNAKNETMTMTYDVLGRIYQRVEPNSGGTTTYEYFGIGNNGVNKVKKITNFNGILEEYTYDAFSRMNTYKTTVDGTARTTTYLYNGFGDNTSVTYPSSLVITREYNTRGYLTFIKSGTTTLFTAYAHDALGNCYSFRQVDDKLSSNSFDKYGYPDQFVTLGIQNLDFTFNNASGNLTGRNDLIAGKNETFTYNNNRLATNTINGTLVNSITYNSNGNIGSKTDAGSYVYHPSKIHAVETVSNTSNYSSATQTISYTPFMQPNVIAENGYALTYTYGSDYNRMKGVLQQNGSTINTRYYFDDYEVDITAGVTRHIHYINGSAGLTSIVVQEAGANKFYAVYSDYQGSILKVTEKNTSGVVVIVGEQNFDAWGRHRKADWTYYAVNQFPTLPVWLYRGYTSHEHLPFFGLINMNGRLYDPVAGRMLSPDNNVTDNTSLQGYNRYAYAMNNPLKFTDPSGENPVLLAAAIIGGVINVVANWNRIDNFWEGLGYFGIGAAAGALGAGVGAGVSAAFAGGSFAAGFAGTSAVSSTGFIAGLGSGFASGFTGGFITGIGNSLLGNQDIGTAIGNGFQMAFKGGLVAGVTNGISGGIDATSKRGANFFTGKANIDLTKGVGAHGLTTSAPNVFADYVGQYEGVNVYEADIGGGVTLPGVGITVYPGAFSRGTDPWIMQHEFGHILQSRQVGALAFYNVIGKESLASAALDGVNGHDHGTFWTETWANYKSSQYFGSRYLFSRSYPIQDVSWFNLFRVLSTYTTPFPANLLIP